MEATLRQWATLRLIPKPPRTISTRALHERLTGHGYEVTKRTVERDLSKLSTVFPLTSDQAGNELRWGWVPGARLGLMEGEAE